MNCILSISDSITITPTHLLCQMSKWTLFQPNSDEPYSSSERERKFRRHLVMSSIKREIRRFPVLVEPANRRRISSRRFSPPARNQKGTEAANGMMRPLSLGHLPFRIVSKQQGVINHWLCRQTDKKSFPQIFSSIWILLVPISSISPTIRKRVVLRIKILLRFPG